MTTMDLPVILESDYTDRDSGVVIDPSANRAARLEVFSGSWGQGEEAPRTQDVDLGMQRRFAALARRWRIETGGVSVSDRRIMHPAYQQIIGLGPRVIPVVLRELEVRPDYWFWALRALTGENPVAEEDAGIMSRMGDAWLNWGRSRGHIG